MVGRAQQDGPSQSTHFMVNPFIINPALSGSEDNIDLKMGYRQQWAGIDGAPRTMYLSGHMPVGKPHTAQTHPGDYHNWCGVGFVAYQHSAGPLSETSVYGNFSYNLRLTKGSGYGWKHRDGLSLSMGMFLGMKNIGWNQEELTQIKTPGVQGEADYVALDVNPENAGSVLDGSFGAMLYYRNQYYLGISANQLFAGQMGFGDGNRLSPHFYLTAGAKWETQDDIYLLPSILTKKVFGAPWSIEANLRVDIKDRFFGGVSLRGGNSGSLSQPFNFDALGLMVGTQIEWKEGIHNFRRGKHSVAIQLFYSYDVPLSALAAQSSGGHEITCGFLLPAMFNERNAEDTWR